MKIKIPHTNSFLTYSQVASSLNESNCLGPAKIPPRLPHSKRSFHYLQKRKATR